MSSHTRSARGWALAAITAAALTVGAGALLGPAFATNKVKADSKVTIDKTSPFFAGKVKSKQAGCAEGRKVKLYVVETGNDKVGVDTTNRNGHWKIQFQGEGVAHYFAKVTKRKEGTAGTIYVCKGDKSPVVQAP